MEYMWLAKQTGTHLFVSDMLQMATHQLNKNGASFQSLCIILVKAIQIVGVNENTHIGPF